MTAVREAAIADLPAVLNVLDGGGLETDYDRVHASIERGETLVAVGDGAERDGTVLGALVLDGDRVTNVAVRPNRRGQGIGTALIEAAADRRDRLVAEFDGDVRSFYEGLDFAVEPATGRERYRGVRTRT